jgi:hypothetical protein
MGFAMVAPALIGSLCAREQPGCQTHRSSDAEIYSRCVRYQSELDHFEIVTGELRTIAMAANLRPASGWQINRPLAFDESQRLFCAVAGSPTVLLLVKAFTRQSVLRREKRNITI